MDETKIMTKYEEDIVAILDEIRDLFLEKNRVYNGDSPFANFTVGGLLMYGDAGYFGRFEALKAYVTKHISNVYTHNIRMPGLDESLRDIATYMVIAIAMKRQYDAILAKEQENAEGISDVDEENPEIPG